MIRGVGRGKVRHSLVMRQSPYSTSQVAELAPSRTLLTVGQAIYEYEEAVKKSPRAGLEIQVPKEFTSKPTASSIANSMERLLSFVLMNEAEVSVTRSKEAFQEAIENLSNPIDAVCLFSGGVDSVSGTLLAAEMLGDIVAVFASHLHQGRVISITRRLAETYLRRERVDLYEIPAPSMSATGYSQTRGLLYILTGASVAAWLQTRKLVVSECGPTMYQPKFAASDQTTMTTHPFIMDRAQEIISEIVPGLKISKPFENLTKAEVMAVCPKPRAFPKTHSCISQRTQLHDGTCYGCVVRRLAAIAASCPDVQYASDPIRNQSARNGNLLTLLSFSVDFLASPRGIPSYQRDMIFGYRKGPLFKRFALDNLSALHALKERRDKLAPAVEAIYQDAVEVLGGIQPMSDRLKELQRIKKTGMKVNF